MSTRDTHHARTVRLGRPSDLAYVYHLQNRMHGSVGYCPRGGLAERLATARIVVVEENGAPAGYVSYTHRRDGTTHLTQIAVEEDIWRTSAGTRLLDWLICDADAHDSRLITLKCAFDLPSNNFWRNSNFLPIAVRTDKRRPLICYARRLVTTVTTPIVFPNSQPRPRNRRVRGDTPPTPPQSGIAESPPSPPDGGSRSGRNATCSPTPPVL
jgi:N-acetylglutamate synthase-like GNAT family acetyltransferase